VVSFLVGGLPLILEHQRELDFRVVELFAALPLAKLCGDGGSTLEYVENIIYFFVLKFLFFFFSVTLTILHRPVSIYR